MQKSCQTSTTLENISMVMLPWGMEFSADQFKHLSTAEKLELVFDLWDDIAEHSENVQPTKKQRIELTKRLDLVKKHPGRGSSWQDVKSRILSQS